VAFGPALPTFAYLTERVLNEQWTDARRLETANACVEALARRGWEV
jgi:hypothetical protein